MDGGCASAEHAALGGATAWGPSVSRLCYSAPVAGLREGRRRGGDGVGDLVERPRSPASRHRLCSSSRTVSCGPAKDRAPERRENERSAASGTGEVRRRRGSKRAGSLRGMSRSSEEAGALWPRRTRSTPKLLYFDCDIMFPSPTLAKADDGVACAASLIAQRQYIDMG